jgi:hypothetical protein
MSKTEGVKDNFPFKVDLLKKYNNKAILMST